MNSVGNALKRLHVCGVSASGAEQSLSHLWETMALNAPCSAGSKSRGTQCSHADQAYPVPSFKSRSV
ncbi:hypothetical protein KC359_g87 [Hortaea werneckii]|nr:hypothetical protein KC359_g87 [Hortaea werneckii]